MTEREGPASDVGGGVEGDFESATDFVLVGIGASAGGLSALSDFFRAVPSDSDLAFVVVVDPDTDHRGEVTDLLQRETAIPVSYVSEDFYPRPNHVYVVAPNRSLSVVGLSVRVGPREDQPPIDLFFRTLSEAFGSRATGVVLSGAGSDGTDGVRRIHAAGGMTLAQSPDEAEFPSMPRSAIATGMVDAVMPASEMPHRLLALGSGVSSPIPASRTDTVEEEASAPLRRIYECLLDETGHDFSEYKQGTVLRRLERRMWARQVEAIADYAHLLANDTEEVHLLLQDLLISVSSFFRDPASWATLERDVIPGLFDAKGPDDTVRAWVAGCATGEEAYTLAMLLKEYATTLDDPPSIQVFATDIDERACRAARAGVYPASVWSSLSPERLQWFLHDDHGLRVVESIRDSVLFAPHDILRDPPFSKVDLVTCRNLLIYLQPQAQERVLRAFHYGLRPGGHLLLGLSESAGAHGLFSPVDPRNRIYVRADLTSRVRPDLTSRVGPGKITATHVRYGVEQEIPTEAADTPADAPADAVRSDTGSDTGSDVEDPGSGGSGKASREQTEAETVAGLEKEVARTRGRLMTALDERDAFVEKLQATNEELRSINEQHRTALEEMEASNEELQSLNEELTTVNREHRGTIEELKLMSADLNNLVEASSVATIFLDRELRLRRFSPSVTSLFNIRAVDLGRPLSHFTHELEYTDIDADAERTLAVMKSLERVVSDGSGRWYSVRMRPYRFGDDRIGGVVITLYEITESKRQQAAEIEARARAKTEEARLQALMRQLPAGVLIIESPSGDVLSANDKAQDIWGRTDLPFASPPGTPGAGYTARAAGGTPFDAETWPISRMLRTGMSIRSEEVEVFFEDGRHAVLLMNGVPDQVSREPAVGDRLGAIVTFLDISQRKAMEGELRTAKSRAEVSNRTKSFFMSALSHEFRTPLNAILGYTDLLAAEREVTDAQGSKLGRIRYAVEHLDAMIDEILGLSGLDEEKASATLVSADARIAARAAVEMCQNLAASNGLPLITTVPDEPIELTTDHDRLRMVLINLIGNAIKFTADGRVELVIRVEEDLVAFEVHDTGLGIAPENHELIFERFWQVSQGLTRTASGVGIGLAAARELSRTLGGDIELQSELGRGSVFTLSLPRMRVRAGLSTLGAPEARHASRGSR